MEVYLNSIEMGNGIYGAEAVAREHFHKNASKLTTGRMCTNCSQPSQSSQVQFKQTWQLHAQKTKEDPLSYEMRPYISTPTRYTFYGFKEEKEITRTPVWAFLF